VNNTTLAYIFVGIAVFQRLAEVVYASRNTRKLLANGGIEIGRSHYPVMVALHTLWLVAIFLMLPKPTTIWWTPLVLVCLLQFGRLWTLQALGPYWTTRVITMPGVPLVKRGPYKYVSHPNYIVVVFEIALFPLVFGEIGVAIVFSILNAAMLYWRIHEEEKGLAPRRELHGVV